MADAPQTLAEWAAHGAINPLQRQVVNTLIEDRALLGMVPILPWPGGEDFSWILNKTSPDFTWEAESETHDSSQPLRRKMTTTLAYGHGDVEIPIHSSSTMDAAMNMEAEDSMELIRSAGISISSKLWTGDYMTEANVTIIGTGLAATPYIDAVTNVSVNTAAGYGDFLYTHTGTFLQYRAPGSTTWGAQVACASDDTYTLYDGTDTTMSVSVTLDVSDVAADTTMIGALLFQRPENIAGLKALAQLDSNQIMSVGTNGDAVTLAQLDELEEMCIGPKSEKFFFMNKRTRRAVKALIGGVGGMKQGEFQGRDLSKYNLNYEGVPVEVDSSIPVNETQGTATTCGRIYCVRLNPQVGYHLFAGAHRGPNSGTMTAISDHSEGGDGNQTPMQLPVYMRRLQEQETTQYYRWRISAAIAGVLKRSKSLSMKYGVTS